MLNDLLQKELEELEELSARLQKSIANAPKGSLHIHRRNEHNVQYYYSLGKDGKVYLAKQNQDLIRKLAQKTYNKRTLVLVRDRIRQLTCTLNHSEKTIRSLYEDMSEERKKLVVPVIPTNESYIKTWYEKHPSSQNATPYINIFYTSKNEPVRSKSEVILADIFASNGIPYVYEPLLVMQNGQVYYPDFLLLNVRLRKTFVFEHFGLMDNPEYAARSVTKINHYHRDGYQFGDSFLCSFETNSSPLDIEVLQKLLSAHLL